MTTPSPACALQAGFDVEGFVRPGSGERKGCVEKRLKGLDVCACGCAGPTWACRAPAGPAHAAVPLLLLPPPFIPTLLHPRSCCRPCGRRRDPHVVPHQPRLQPAALGEGQGRWGRTPCCTRHLRRELPQIQVHIRRSVLCAPLPARARASLHAQAAPNRTSPLCVTGFLDPPPPPHTPHPHPSPPHTHTSPPTPPHPHPHPHPPPHTHPHPTHTPPPPPTHPPTPHPSTPHPHPHPHPRCQSTVLQTPLLLGSRQTWVRLMLEQASARG